MADKEKLCEKLAEKHVETTNVPVEFRKETSKLVKSMMMHKAYDNPNYKWTLDDFELDKRLGRGKFGRVYLAREKKTGFIVAIKTMYKKELVEAKYEIQTLREIEIQSHLKHPNILELLTWFHDDFRIYLVLEYAAQGTLYNHLKINGPFNEQVTARYINQIADAVHYCHQNNVIHRDIKPENLLLTINGDIKLGDFGWSIHTTSSKRKRLCGTLDYLAPEIVQGNEYGLKVDNWCLGILCYELLTGHPPFESQTDQETYYKITTFDVIYPSYFSSGAKNLIVRLLIKDDVRRMTLTEVINHHWIVANK